MTNTNIHKQHGKLNTDESFLLIIRIIFDLSFFMIGLYYEMAAAIVSSALLILLLWRIRKDSLTIHINDALLAVSGVSIFYFLSALWAVDSGIALWGGVKYLPLLLFGLCVMQVSSGERQKILMDIPWIGGAMTVLSFILQYIPLFQSAFSVSGRLAGFFQYPNTFACFLLLGFILLLTGENSQKRRWMNILCGILLLFGILQAGSRTVFLLTIPAILACLFIQRKKENLYFLIFSAAAGAALAFAAGLLGNAGGAERITEISANASTLLGRFLYWKDAVPVILEHPLGFGYLGYYFMQGSFQTGVYSVRWVHNDFLQLLLDVGWIPSVLAVFAVVRALFSKRTTASVRVLMLVLLAHCMTDFDLEFIAMFFILLLCLDWEDQRKRIFRVPAVPATVAAVAVAGGSLYLGAASTLTYAGCDDAAVSLYPWNTLSQIALLSEKEDIDELNQLSDRILDRNNSVALAWDARALAAYAEGDFGSMITAKREAIALARYDTEEYQDYFEKLRTGYELYLSAGDADSAAICLEEIRSIQTLLDEVAADTDNLAWRLEDTPQLNMPDEYTEFLEQVDGESQTE